MYAHCDSGENSISVLMMRQTKTYFARLFLWAMRNWIFLLFFPFSLRLAFLFFFISFSLVLHSVLPPFFPLSFRKKRKCKFSHPKTETDKTGGVHSYLSPLGPLKSSRRFDCATMSRVPDNQEFILSFFPEVKMFALQPDIFSQTLYRHDILSFLSLSM